MNSLAENANTGPLKGIRVIDLTTVLMGPYTSQTLGDYGADVIKVESPEGDNVRFVGPARNEGMSGTFMLSNRNKRSVTLNLKQADDLVKLQDLVRTADVLLFNIRPKAMKRLGLSYEQVRELKQDIIYVGLYGYGQNGPYADKPAYDDLIQGAVGFPSLAQRAGSSTPVYVPTPIVDRFVGATAVGAITAALYHREKTGEGQEIGIPMFETMASVVLADHIFGHAFEPPMSEIGYPRILNEYRRPYQTKDGYICIMLYNDRHWEAFFKSIDKFHLIENDMRFSSITQRTTHIAALYAMISDEISEKTTAEWISLLNEADIPVMPMHTLESLLQDEHIQATQFVKKVNHPSEGEILEIAIPSVWSKTQPTVHTPAPRLGEHNEAIFK